MTLTRWQNAIVALLPAAQITVALAYAWRRRDGAAARAVLLGGTVFVVAAAVVFLPQMLAWKAIYGQFLAVSPEGPQMFWRDPKLVDVLWSSRSGLFATSPVIYAAAIGLVLLWRRDRRLSVAGAAMLALMSWTNGAVEDWYAGASYGGRRFDSLIPFFVAGLAALIAAAARAIARRPGLAAAAILAVLVVWNVTLMAVARSGLYRIGQPVSFGDLAAAQAALLHGWIGHPASYPVNLLYAAAHGVGPGRYDLLGPNRFLGDPTRPYGRIDIGGADEVYVENGWHAPERAGDRTFRWATGEALVLVPLDHAADLLIQVELQPFDVPGAEPQRLVLEVNGRPLEPLAVPPGWSRVQVRAAAGLWHPGPNRVRLRFARDARPADLGGSDDVRPLAAAVDWVRVEKVIE